MSRARFLRNFWPLAVAAFVLEVGLYLAMGQRWFSFYGHALTALLLIFPLGWLFLTRFRTLGLSRWWPGIFFTLVGLAAIIQIAYWTAFFSSSRYFAVLAMARNLALERGEFMLGWAALGIAGFGSLLLWKAISRS